MTYSYLALGDSYTIGEQVVLSSSFPYQIIQQLRRKMPDDTWLAPEIIAKTGWTTDELHQAISQYTFLGTYDFVSLLIGVNNQYRGRNVEDFGREFRELLQTALRLSNDMPNRVFVISIPDWGVTPFAAGRDIETIATEITQFNQVCRYEAALAEVHFIDITESQREDGKKADFLAPDGLHPSEKEYKKWAELISDTIIETLED